MKHIEEILLEEMVSAIEKKQEAELRLIIAEKEYAAIQAAYKAYIEAQ